MKIEQHGILLSLLLHSRIRQVQMRGGQGVSHSTDEGVDRGYPILKMKGWTGGYPILQMKGWTGGYPILQMKGWTGGVLF